MRAQCFGALLRPLLGPGSRRGALPANRFLHTTRAVRQEASQTAPAEEQTWSESPLVAEGDDCLEVRWPDDTASSLYVLLVEIRRFSS